MEEKSDWFEDDGRIGLLSKFLSSIPKSEQNEAALILANVQLLAGFANDFDAAVVLIDRAEQVENLLPSTNTSQHYSEQFRELAARDAVLTFYQFGESLRFIKGGVVKCGSLKCFIRQVQTVCDELESQYSTQMRRNIRDAVAHRAEITKDMPTFLEGAVDGCRIIGRLVGREFQITNRNEHAVLPVTRQTHLLLCHLVERMFAVFPMLAERKPTRAA